MVEIPYSDITSIVKTNFIKALNIFNYIIFNQVNRSSFTQELGLFSTWRILRQDLDVHPFKIQLTQELKINDHRQRCVFADWVLKQLEVNPNFVKQIIFSDEAHFWMNEYVNKTGHRDRDLTPLDFFLWGYLKSQVYTNKPQTIDALKVNIINVIQQIQPDLCEKVIENWTARIRVTKRSRGGNLSDVIFHT
ncbi:hypothetical protein ALC53_03207 [Atta colombica]|uniref:Uncharacterized protein n=1 Tax=Atta colombica TaxID=520822 RepID=A0A151I5A3_9HYME|nr:hypothetical protein ALC53_03207 [Atta colombica]